MTQQNQLGTLGTLSWYWNDAFDCSWFTEKNIETTPYVNLAKRQTMDLCNFDSPRYSTGYFLFNTIDLLLKTHEKYADRVKATYEYMLHN
jgi:hypothetical protein